MALGKKLKPRAKTERKTGRFVTIMQVCEGMATADKPAREYIKANNHKGRLLWQSFGGPEGDDESESSYYEITSANIYEPHENAPDFVLQNIVINLNYEKSAVCISGPDSEIAF